MLLRVSEMDTLSYTIDRKLNWYEYWLKCQSLKNSYIFKPRRPHLEIYPKYIFWKTSKNVCTNCSSQLKKRQWFSAASWINQTLFFGSQGPALPGPYLLPNFNLILRFIPASLTFVPYQNSTKFVPSFWNILPLSPWG